METCYQIHAGLTELYTHTHTPQKLVHSSLLTSNGLPKAVIRNFVCTSFVAVEFTIWEDCRNSLGKPVRPVSILHLTEAHTKKTLSSAALTFALQTLSEKSSKKPLAVLAHRRSSVWVNSERVGHLYLAHQHLVEMNWSPRVKTPGVASCPWLAE